MKLKTLIAATALVAISGSAMAATPTSSPFSGLIQFQGGIVEDTCDVNVLVTEEGKGTTSQGGLIIDGYTAGVANGGNVSTAVVGLGYYTPDEAKAWATTSPAIAFTVQLSNCAATPSTWTISGEVGIATNILKTEGENKSVMGIGITPGTAGGDSSKFVLNNTPESIPAATNIGTTANPINVYDIPFVAQYAVLETGAVVTQSPENGLISFNVNY